ncbi:MAG: transcription elongation factor GreA [Candidatus Vogelbacteria bacterium]|nr:transcription elongation factor GreA [Candidatus Vogelbacteria bacterium]
MATAEQYVSKEKYEQLSSELEELKTIKRKEIADKLNYAKSLGDLSENSEYHEARDAQAALEDRIARLERIIKFAVITEDHHSNVAEIGSTVLVQRDGVSESERLHIVGSEEANFAQNKVSNESPLGQAMLGKMQGEAFVVATPRGTIHYKILDIE